MARLFVQVAFALVSVVLDLAVAQELSLSVAYPVPSDRGVVELTCRASLFPVDDAQFRRNNSVIAADNNLVTVLLEGAGTIKFSFTQEQEGYFTCTASNPDRTSNEIGLAGIGRSLL